MHGQWHLGLPDVTHYRFVDGILDDRPIDIYNHGDMHRDFAHVHDLARGIWLLISAVFERPEDGKVPKDDSQSPVVPFRFVNIGNYDKGRLLDFCGVIEECLEKRLSETTGRCWWVMCPLPGPMQIFCNTSLATNRRQISGAG